MNPIQKAIRDRYSCRDFTGAPLSKEQITALAEAALAAPSAMNFQPWHIIVVSDKAMLEEFDADAMSIIKESDPAAYERMASRGGSILYNAPCLVLIAKNSSGSAALDSGIASQNVALAAHGMGLGSVICGMAGIPLYGPRGGEWAKRLQIPEGYSFGMSVCVGEAKSGKEPHELDMNKLTYV